MGALLLCGAVLAQGERILEPLGSANVSSDVRPEWYVGTSKPRFVSWYTSNTYAVLNEPVLFQFTYFGGSTVKAIRFTPIAGGSSLRINVDGKRVVQSQTSNSYLGAINFVPFVVNASDFGVNAGSKTYRVALVDADGREGEPIEMTLNFRSRTDYRPDPASARAGETLSGVVPIGYFQAQAGGSVFIPSVQNFQSYSRLWLEIRLPSNFDLNLNIGLFRTAASTGVVSLSDDAGQRYAVTWDDRAVSSLPDGNGFRFAVVMTPALSPSAKRLILVQAPIKPENLLPGFTPENINEPFRSGLTLNLPLLR